MQSDVPIVKELVFVGGGHTHALVLRKWGMRPVPGVRVTLINPGATAPYSGMLPGHIAGHYTRDALDIDLVRLARFANARLIVDRAVALDPAAKRLTLADGRSISYDLVSLDIGITSEMPRLPGFAEHGVAAKPLGRFADTWAEVCEGQGDLSIAILGGGVAGCEVAMAAVHRMRALGRKAHVSVIDRGHILSHVVPAARRRLLAALARHGVTLIEQATPALIGAGFVELEDGRRLVSDLTIGTAGATPQAWIAETGLPCRDGFLEVDEYLRSPADPTIYAAGDCAHVVHDPRPKAGVYAVRAAPSLAHNLRADLIGTQRRAFNPQRDFLKLISMGEQRAVAEKGGIATEGAALWRWKNSIDQKFMDQFRSLPAMDPPKAPPGAAKGVAQVMAGPAPCGGCGAKLPSDALTPVLDGAFGAQRDDVRLLPGDDAAIIGQGKAQQVISTDHLRAFANDPALVARVAAVHAMGDIWAMGAEPQAAVAQVILPRLASRLQADWLSEVMASAGAVFKEAGVALAGGHSSMGPELHVGFTVTGVPRHAPITLAGAQIGDALILTKPIGSGVVLAAEMRGLAAGEDVLACWQTMAEPSGDASKVLAPHVRAMTDVTGFGLAGHLHNICKASGVGASVNLADVPVLSGALGLASQGIRSTLWTANRTALNAQVPDSPMGDLMFDPQTAGGLLAAVPSGKVAEILARLPDAVQIGSVTETQALVFR